MSTKPKYKAIRSKNPYDCSVESERDIICQRCTWTGARKIAKALNEMEASKKPKPKPFAFDWSGVPKKYKWAAMDGPNRWFVFTKKPSKREGDNDDLWIQGGHYIELTRPPYPGDWRDSLQERK